MCINGVWTASLLYCDGSLMQDILPAASAITVMCECPDRDLCVQFVVSVACVGLFVGGCSVGFFNNFYY